MHTGPTLAEDRYCHNFGSNAMRCHLERSWIELGRSGFVYCGRWIASDGYRFRYDLLRRRVYCDSDNDASQSLRCDVDNAWPKSWRHNFFLNVWLASRERRSWYRLLCDGDGISDEYISDRGYAYRVGDQHQWAKPIWYAYGLRWASTRDELIQH